jgi:hypothetical protein
MTLLATSLILWLAAAAGEAVPTVIQAPDSPVRVDHAQIFNVVPNEPAVLMYAATNVTDDDLEQFTVLVFFFDAEGTLKARQIAPGRRTLEKHTTKYSTMVLDGWAMKPTDRVVFGVNQAQRTESDKWWSAELDAAATEVVKKVTAVPRGAPNYLRNDAFADRIEHDLSCVVQIELLHQIGPVGLDRGKPQVKEHSHLLVRSALGEQLEDLSLPVGEQVEGVGQPTGAQATHVVLDEHRGHRRTEVRFSRRDGADRRNEIFVRRTLEQVPSRAHGQGTNDVRLVGVHAEDDHARRLRQLLGTSRDLDAIELWHRDVEDHHVRAERLAQSYRFEAIGSLANHLDLRIFEQTA